MTAFTYALQLTILTIKDGQRQIWTHLQMLHMVNDHRLAVPTFALAALALPAIQPQDLVAYAVRLSPPLRPVIELMFTPLRYQCPKLIQAVSGYHILTVQWNRRCRMTGTACLIISCYHFITLFWLWGIIFFDFEAVGSSNDPDK